MTDENAPNAARSIAPLRAPSDAALPGVRRHERIDTGPSIRTRVRLLALAASIVVLPVLVLGVYRAAAADEAARAFREADALSTRFHVLEVQVERARGALVRFEAQPEIENEVQLVASLDEVSRAILAVGDAGILPDGTKRLADVKSTTRRVRLAIDEAVRKRDGGPDPASVRRGHLALETLAKSAAALGDDARRLAADRAMVAERLVSHAGRDQLVLSIVLVVGIAFLVGLGPGWVLAPLARLRAFTQRIDAGRVQEVAAHGNDEVAELTRAVRTAVRRAQSDNEKRAGKISEMGNVLHAIVEEIDDAVLVVGDDKKIDYVSKKAAEILGKPLHNIRGEHFENVMFAPALTDAITRTLGGDVHDEPVDAVVESADGRVTHLKATFRSVSDRQGEIARAIVVLRA